LSELSDLYYCFGIFCARNFVGDERGVHKGQKRCPHRTKEGPQRTKREPGGEGEGSRAPGVLCVSELSDLYYCFWECKA